MKRLALKSALSQKVIEEKLIVLEDLKLNEIKTKEMKKVVDSLNLNKALFVLEGSDNKNVLLSARNLPNVKTAGVNSINVYDILKFENFVVTKEAVEKMQEVYA